MAIKMRLVRDYAGPGPEQASLTKEEKASLKEVKEKYYKNNWSKVVLKFLRFANPNIANA